jgi:hypothetical protein
MPERQPAVLKHEGDRFSSGATRDTLTSNSRVKYVPS